MGGASCSGQDFEGAESPLNSTYGSHQDLKECTQKIREKCAFILKPVLPEQYLLEGTGGRGLHTDRSPPGGSERSHGDQEQSCSCSAGAGGTSQGACCVNT